MTKPTNALPLDAYRLLLEQQERNTRRTRPRHLESDLQKVCVSWFRAQYPSHALMLFAVPNGGARSRTEAAIMKAEGVTAGVSDLILLEPRGGYGALCIEMKTKDKDSRQRPSQKAWQEATEKAGNKYVLCRSLKEFQEAVRSYMVLQSPTTDGGWNDASTPPPRPMICRVRLIYETYTATWNGKDWIDETGFRLRGVDAWRQD